MKVWPSWKAIPIARGFPMKNPRPLVLTSMLAVGVAGGSSGCRQGIVAAARAPAKSTPISVDVLVAQQTTMQRTATQPATVHAYYQTRVFAKAAGYLTDLNVDIGSTVKAGDVLAVIGIPEMGKQREAKLADIRRLEADERRAGSQMAVAEASTASLIVSTS
jgi:multidrug efflux pump subunit AcrA (membrane-fusion protein)